MITNPVLPGFNPDPSIVRVGDDYYIATSTFEWFPGVRIYHSKDLQNWKLVATPLDRAELLDMTGVPDSCGVWAPCLSWSEGRFWLCYTVVTRFDGNFKDTSNYITSCETIEGTWTSPVFVNSQGFDPSLFHDDDGRSYYLNMIWDHRPDRTFFGGILMQEICRKTLALTGPRKIIFPGTEADGTEGPHLYKNNGWYYLVTAEGGTGYDHQVTVARSKNIWGPYEADPEGPVLTACHLPDNPIQRTGHGALVDTPAGELYFTHLCSRPLEGTRRSPLGRESGIQKFAWTSDGWLRKDNGSCVPDLHVEPPVGAQQSQPEPAFERDDFEEGTLHPVYQWLRVPDPSNFMSLSDRPGWLRLTGRNSLGSHFEQALIARRQTDQAFEVTTRMDFNPDWFQKMAGLVLYYNAHKFHYLYVSFDDEFGKHIGVMSCEGDQSLAATFPVQDQCIKLDKVAGPVWLKATVLSARLDFAWSTDGETWHDVVRDLDASLLCDEVGKGDGANFTGNFVGICCQDLTGENTPADFDLFSYRAL